MRAQRSVSVQAGSHGGQDSGCYLCCPSIQQHVGQPQNSPEPHQASGIALPFCQTLTCPAVSLPSSLACQGKNSDGTAGSHPVPLCCQPWLIACCTGCICPHQNHVYHRTVSVHRVSSLIAFPCPLPQRALSPSPFPLFLPLSHLSRLW